MGGQLEAEPALGSGPVGTEAKGTACGGVCS
jgi:hypothetical protein